MSLRDKAKESLLPELKIEISMDQLKDLTRGLPINVPIKDKYSIRIIVGGK